MSSRPIVEVAAESNPTTKIRRQAVTQEEVDSMGGKDEAFVKSLNSLVNSIDSKPAPNAMPSYDQQMAMLRQMSPTYNERITAREAARKTFIGKEKTTRPAASYQELINEKSQESKGDSPQKVQQFVGRRQNLPQSRTSSAPLDPLELDTEAMQMGKVTSGHIKRLLRRFPQPDKINVQRLPAQELYFISHNKAELLLRHYSLPKSSNFKDWANQRGFDQQSK